MLQIKDLLSLELFSSFRLVAGEEGLKKEVLNATILEYETIKNDYGCFYKGDFIITSLFYAKDNPDLIKKSFQELYAQEVAAIAVKSAFYDELPEDAVTYAREKHIPLFLFDDIFMEDIIFCIKELVKQKKMYQYREQELSKILDRCSGIQVAQCAYNLNRFIYSHYFAAYFTLKDQKSDFNEYFKEICNADMKHVQDYVSVVQYKNGFYLIYNFSFQDSFDIKRFIRAELLRIGAVESELYCGVSEIHSDLTSIDSACQQAMFANRFCIIKSNSYSSYSELGIYKYIASLAQDKTAVQQYHKAIDILNDYDENYNSQLIITLRAYVKNGGSIKKTGEELFQHPNTIRYRIQKTEELLNLDSFYENAFFLIRLYEWLDE